MWYDIIPSYVIIAAAMGAPHGIAYVLNWLVVGNCYRRELQSFDQHMQYLRDKRLTGDPYKLTGLEDIPDEVEKECDEEDSTGKNETETEKCPKETEVVTDENKGDENKGDENKGDKNKGDENKGDGTCEKSCRR